jgi:trans-AT polyketide synthase, acyltransferase and oxidoreductase domains
MIDSAELRAALHDVHRPLTLDGAFVPALPPERLGDPSFRADHGLKFAYVAGAMANGIGSVEIVQAMAGAGMLGFFGSAGLSLSRIEAAIDRLQTPVAHAPGSPVGFNLIHSPNEPGHEAATVELYLKRGVRLVEASAYLDLTPAVVRYRVSGLKRGPNGEVIAPNRVIAKVSRVEVATRFFSPPPEKHLRELRASNQITAEEATLAAEIPMAQDLTAEADSGGHTDNRPLVALLPTIFALRDRCQERFGDRVRLRVGAAGGLATPQGLAAAFALGAAYVLTGSINQACVESGSSDLVRKMLAEAGQADVIMAPAADMFEMGVRVQVLKRGTLFPMRAAKLFELYRSQPSLEAIPAAERARLDKELFRVPIEAIWSETQAFWRDRDPAQLVRADRDPKHKMALVFRWYLGMSSRWANSGIADRQVDFQVWCGSAMGAFNEWTKGTFLEQPANRKVAVVARNLMHGAAVATRAHILACQGFPLPADVSRIVPREDL